jgi:hypothetical protein
MCSYARCEFDVLNLTDYNSLGVQSSNDHPCLRTSPPPPLLWWASSNIYSVQHRVLMNSLSLVSLGGGHSAYMGPDSATTSTLRACITQFLAYFLDTQLITRMLNS